MKNGENGIFKNLVLYMNNLKLYSIVVTRLVMYMVYSFYLVLYFHDGNIIDSSQSYRDGEREEKERV